ncbi:MAG: hypothetical protein ACD_71C00189G0003 [uncultured bacterium (gcode 4)]|uniref:Uncharacterized protein n=1 Tax=uncultured bacterium (gcode 4) TaxID=1234023 RepID=K2A2P4_9BACT|nr:MAG: hypothetical protein ACD_71C00189G0003 [uncultured bacterium (gcode 4)]
MSLVPRNELSEDTKNASEKLSLFMKQPGISEVLEWTFMYDKQSILDKTPYNTTFFDVIGGISYQEWKEQKITSEQLILGVNSKFTVWIHELEEIKNTLSTKETTSEKTILEYEGINFIIVWIQAARSATIIELEKSSKTPILTPHERQRFCWEVESGQEKLYGSKISENMEESIMSLDLLCREFSENGENLTWEQQKRFLDIYDNLKKKVEECWTGTNLETPDIHNFHKKPIPQHNFTKEVLEKIKNIKIPREIYMRLWQGYIDAMGLHQKVVSNPNASSIYDGPITLEVPDSSWYDNISLKRVLELMVHEIWAHYANQAISKQNDFSIRWAKNIEKEEGLAIVLEYLLEGKKLIDIKWPGYAFPYILAGEYLSKDERQDLVDLRLKMDGDKGDEGHRRDLRVMRGYPLDGPWSQRKDASYGRGVNKIVDLVTNGKCSLTDFYKGKFSIDDIASWRLDALISKEKIVFPLLFPEMLLFMAGVGRQEFTHERFMTYMQEKYAGDISEDDLNNIEVIKEFSKIKIFITMWRDIENYLPNPID